MATEVFLLVGSRLLLMGYLKERCLHILFTPLKKWKPAFATRFKP
jgi:hypothetical protein